MPQQPADTEAQKTKPPTKTSVKLPAELSVNYEISFSGPDQEAAYSVNVFDGDQQIEVPNKDEFDELVDSGAHKTIFWTAEDRYLISKPINIEQFIADPNISIPLKNCFRLAAIQQDQIAQKLNDSQSDSTECEYLENELGEKVTAHIKSAWPNHPIEVTFKIMGGNIHFHVKDVGARGKAQTSDMRSDGFKQFVSFLLTVAAENRNEELHNTILLLDEPETHLHPKAQEYLLMQLVNITNNDKNNVVFFATHSNYMIDKKDLGRYHRVEKKKDDNNEEQTIISQFDNKQTTYAEVSYEVFDVLDEQYHNELYDKLRDTFIQQKNSQEEDTTKHIDSIGIRPFDEQYFNQVKSLPKSFKDTSRPNDENAKVTLPTFVRNCIHYPQNKKSNFEEKLKESIEVLRSYLTDSGVKDD
ncbi:MAG: AAA family ATPase [Candidatus Saccharimonadales bacterium]